MPGAGMPAARFRARRPRRARQVFRTAVSDLLTAPAACHPETRPPPERGWPRGAARALPLGPRPAPRARQGAHPMRRVVVVLVVLIVVLAGLIALRLWTQARALAAPSGGSGEIEGTDGRPLLARRRPDRSRCRVREGERGEGGRPPRAARLRRSRGAARGGGGAARGGEGAGGRGEARRSRRRSARGVAAGAAEEAARAQAAALAAQRDAAERQAKRLAALPQDVPASSIDQTQASAQGLEHQTEAAKAQATASAAQARAADVGDPRGDRPGGGGARAGARRGGVRRARARSSPASARCARRATREVATLPHEAGELVAPGAVLVAPRRSLEVKATFYLPNAEIGAVKPGRAGDGRRGRLAGRVVRGHGPHGGARGGVHPAQHPDPHRPRPARLPGRGDGDEPRREARAGMPVQVTLPGTGR